MRNVERAKQIATEKGINVSFVCREIGKSRGYISQMLVSGRDLPDDMIEPVANALGVSVDYLTGQTDNPYPTERNVNATVFYERYLELCASVDKTPSGAALEMGLSKPTVNRWKNGGGITDATARKVAAYFDVPVDYLTGQTDDPAPEQKEKAPLSDVDRLMEGLNAESIRKLREYAELLLLGQEKEEKEKE